MTHITCRLTAKNRDQLRNPTLGNRVWVAFIFRTRSLVTRVSVRTRDLLHIDWLQQNWDS